MDWEIVYDNQGKAIGKKRKNFTPKEEDKGLVGNIVSSMVDPFSRLGRGLSNVVGAKIGGDQNFLSDEEKEAYKNPWNVAKDLASAGSVFIPGAAAGSGIKGAAVAGAKTGALSGFGSTYNQNTEDTIKGTLTGAAGGSVLGAALPFLGKALGGKGNKVAQESAENASKGGFFDKAKSKFDLMKGAELEVPMGKGSFNPYDTKLSLVSNLDKRGLPKTLDGIKEGMQRAGSEINPYLDDVLAKSGGKRIPGGTILDDDFANQLKSIELGIGAKPGSTKSFVNEFLTSKDLRGTGSAMARDFNVADAVTGVQKINAALRDKTLTGPRKQVAMALKDRLDDVIAKEAPGYKDLAKEYAIYATAENPTATKLLKGDQTASQNVLQTFLPASQLKNKATKALGDVGSRTLDALKGKGLSIPGLEKAMPFLNNGVTQKGLVLGGLAGSRGGGSRQESMAPESIEESFGPDQEAQIMESQYRQADIEQRYNEAFNTLLEMGYKPVDAQKNAMALVSPMGGEGEGKGPTVNDKKTYSYANAGLRSLDEIENILSKDGGANWGAQLPGALGFLKSSNSRQLETAIANAADSIGRLRSGGAVSKDEEERFRNQLPGLFDDPETARRKLANVRAQLMEVIGE